MNKEQDYASDSDESDEDFCLENEHDAESGEEEEEEDSESESDNEDDAEADKKPGKAAKGKRKDKVKKKLIDTANADAGVTRSTRQTEPKENRRKAAEKDELESDEEVDKSRSDALWADFLGDVGASSEPAAKPKENPSPAKRTQSPPSKPNKQATEILDFAGEQVIVSKSNTSSSSSSSAKENQEQPAAPITKSPAPRGFAAGKRPAANGGGAGGLGSLLNQLGKKKKMSVLEKSQLDWKSFKSDEGIDEELQTHNKGKDGYLERQDFLQRTDLRQFEIEKNMRQTRRQN
ncbi:craniofacial development protein 1 isoform X2 [Drosophila hydei]|uniref:Craniofacial development protein 1 n=1 Tax=Drosophila hydei TaxID=7224 RepID=A0A6J1MEL3_DROHY|nr:craniofacial development protein 1 isoform X2 [Drosophila hydei]